MSRSPAAAFELLSRLPRQGVGSKLSRHSWQDASYWLVTDVRMAKVGAALGELHKYLPRPTNSEQRNCPHCSLCIIVSSMDCRTASMARRGASGRGEVSSKTSSRSR